jgi:hypothetical protein
VKRCEASAAALAEEDRQGAVTPVDRREATTFGWMRVGDGKPLEDGLLCETDFLSLFASYRAFADADHLCCWSQSERGQCATGNRRTRRAAPWGRRWRWRWAHVAAACYEPSRQKKAPAGGIEAEGTLLGCSLRLRRCRAPEPASGRERAEVAGRNFPAGSHTPRTDAFAPTQHHIHVALARKLAGRSPTAAGQRAACFIGWSKCETSPTRDYRSGSDRSITSYVLRAS